MLKVEYSVITALYPEISSVCKDMGNEGWGLATAIVVDKDNYRGPTSTLIFQRPLPERVPERPPSVAVDFGENVSARFDFVDKTVGFLCEACGGKSLKHPMDALAATIYPFWVAHQLSGCLAMKAKSGD